MKGPPKVAAVGTRAACLSTVAGLFRWKGTNALDERQQACIVPPPSPLLRMRVTSTFSFLVNIKSLSYEQL